MKRSIYESTLIAIFSSLIVFPATAVHAVESTITVPIFLDLEYVEKTANAKLPKRLATIHERKKVCIPAKWAKFDYPCFKDFKLYKCKGKTKISPNIYCDINGYVDRRGKLTIGGRGETLTISLPVHASVSAKAVVRETAKADATFFVNAVLGISEDWKPSLSLQSNFRWDKRPELKLFNLIKVTIGSKVEPKIREKMAQLEAQASAFLLSKNIRANIEKIWRDIQKPVQITSNPKAYSIFKPTLVGFSTPTITGKTLTAQVTIKGETRVVVGSVSRIDPVPLLPLMKNNFTDGEFSLLVPIIINETEVQSAIDRNYKNGIEIKVDRDRLKGIFSASNFSISFTKRSGIHLKANVAYDNRSKWLRFADIFDWFTFSGTAEFKVIPVLNAGENIITVQKIRLESSTSSSLVDIMVRVLDFPVVRNQIAKVLRYNFSDDLGKAMKLANEAMNVTLNNGVTMTGILKSAGVRKVVVGDRAITVFAHAHGTIQAFVRE